MQTMPDVNAGGARAFGRMIPSAGGALQPRRISDMDRLHTIVIAAIAAVAPIGPAWAISEEAPSIEILAFERFIAATAPVCSRSSSHACFALAFDFADANGDRGLAPDELLGVRDALADWSAWRDGALTVQERNSIRLGLWLVDTVGLETLHASYDEDGDGLLSGPELLADVGLDDRPMGEVLLDPEAVDRAAVARRLGALSPLLDRALPKSAN